MKDQMGIINWTKWLRWSNFFFLGGGVCQILCPYSDPIMKYITVAIVLLKYIKTDLFYAISGRAIVNDTVKFV